MNIFNYICHRKWINKALRKFYEEFPNDEVDVNLHLITTEEMSNITVNRISKGRMDFYMIKVKIPYVVDIVKSGVFEITFNSKEKD